jgi:hypothetical protein
MVSSSSSESSLPSTSSYYISNQSTIIKKEAVKEQGQISSSLYSTRLDDKTESVTAGLQAHLVSLLKKQSSQNAETIADYVLAMNIEVNPSIHHRTNQIRTLSYLSDFHKQKPFSKMTRDDVLPVKIFQMAIIGR